MYALLALVSHAPSVRTRLREELAIASARVSLRVRYVARRAVKKIAERF